MADERPPPNRLDAGARGGMAGYNIVMVVLIGVLYFYGDHGPNGFPGFAVMLGVGSILGLLCLDVAKKHRRYFSAVLWLALALLLTTAYLLLKMAPGEELRRFWEEDPSRERNVLLIAALLTAVALVSFWMLRRRPGRPSQ